MTAEFSDRNRDVGSGVENGMTAAVCKLAVVSLASLVLAGPSFAPISAQAQRSGIVVLTFECAASRNLRFVLKNTGDTDTTVVLGRVIGNGRKYTVSGLDLVVKMPTGSVTVYGYSPRHYPSAIGGSLGEWLQALPMQSAYSMSATADDFFDNASERLSTFPPGAELSLRWTIPAPRPQAMLLAFWSGTLTSNACRPAS